MSNSCIWPIDKTLSGATTPGQSGPRNDGKEGILLIPQFFSITGASPSYCFMSYQEYLLGGGITPSAEKQSVYTTAPADWDVSYFDSIGEQRLFSLPSMTIWLLLCLLFIGQHSINLEHHLLSSLLWYVFYSLPFLFFNDFYVVC